MCYLLYGTFSQMSVRLFSSYLFRLNASIDETSFWQFLFVLSSAMKPGECTPAQLVVKLHYVLNTAQYTLVASVEESDGVDATQAMDVVPGPVQAVASVATSSGVQFSVVGGYVGEASLDSGTHGLLSDLTVDGSTSHASATPAVEHEVDAVAPVLPKPPVKGFGSKFEAIRGFNLFLPVLVGKS